MLRVVGVVWGFDGLKYQFYWLRYASTSNMHFEPIYPVHAHLLFSFPLTILFTF